MDDRTRYTLALEFFEHVIRLDTKFLDGAVDGVNAEDIEWLNSNDGIYFTVDWQTQNAPVFTHFYTPYEALENIWRQMGYEGSARQDGN